MYIHLFYILLLLVCLYIFIKIKKQLSYLALQLNLIDNDNSIILRQCDNGYIITFDKKTVSGDMVVRKPVQIVFGNNKETDGNLIALRQALIYIRNYMGEYWQEERKNNILIELSENKLNDIFDKLSKEDKKEMINIYKKYI
jgi:hypothetical protein